jgi:hypothetical protein
MHRFCRSYAVVNVDELRTKVRIGELVHFGSHPQPHFGNVEVWGFAVAGEEGFHGAAGGGKEAGLVEGLEGAIGGCRVGCGLKRYGLGVEGWMAEAERSSLRVIIENRDVGR